MIGDDHILMMQDPAESMEIEEVMLLLRQNRLEETLAERTAQWRAYVAAYEAAHPAPAAATPPEPPHRKPSRADIARVLPPVSHGTRALAPAPDPLKQVTLTIPLLTEEEKQPGRIVMQLFGPGATVLTTFEGITEHELNQWISEIEAPPPPPATPVPAATFTLPNPPPRVSAPPRETPAQTYQMRLL